MTDAEPQVGQPGGASRRFLTFRMESALYALPAEEVSEVIRMPSVARVPLGPPSLLGIANLRGTVLPLTSLRGLLGRAEEAAAFEQRAIVLDGGAPVALAVDEVNALVSVEPERVETSQAALSAQPGERLRGAFDVEGAGVAKILDLDVMLSEAFAERSRERRAAPASAAAGHDRAAEDERQRRMLITFEVAGQEFALPLDTVREVIPAPANVARAPRAEAVVLGVSAYRETLLPLLSLRGLLGFAQEATGFGGKVLVTRVAGVLVGLVADAMRAVLPADPELIEATSPVLASRTGGESQITAIYRADDGRRLISILDPDHLFRGDVMQRLGGNREEDAAPQGQAAIGDDLQFVIFRLGDDEYGLPIEAVDEVAEAPAHITKLPKTPKFLEGVVNLRGEVLPVIDQRRRFDMAQVAEAAGRRLMVVRSERHRAGLLVDAVSRVLRAPAEALEPPPALTDQTTRLVRGVINLEAEDRIVLILDASELLSHAERGLLDKFQAELDKAPS